MRLTTKGQIALTAMVDIARHPGAAPVPLSGISARLNISVSYLEILFKKLRRCSLVRSARGPRGGYRLGRNAARITIADIVLAVDDFTYAKRRGGGRKRLCDEQSVASDLWARLNRIALDYLATITLDQAVEDHRDRTDRERAPQDFLSGMAARGVVSPRLRAEPGPPAPRAETARRLGGPRLQHGFTLADSTVGLASLGILAALTLLAL